MIPHTTMTCPVAPSLRVAFRLADGGTYYETAGDIAWAIADPAEGRPLAYLVVGPEGEGWRSFTGRLDANRPLNGRTLVDVLHRDGTRSLDVPACALTWDLTGAPSDPVAWRQAATPAAPPATPAESLLRKAAEHMSDRASAYDTPGGERSMRRAVAAVNAITGRSLTEAEGWLLMLALKQVRLFTRRDQAHRDSAEDAIAYAALLGESALCGGLEHDPR